MLKSQNNTAKSSPTTPKPNGSVKNAAQKEKEKGFKFNIQNVNDNVNGTAKMTSDHYYNPISKHQRKGTEKSNMNSKLLNGIDVISENEGPAENTTDYNLKPLKTDDVDFVFKLNNLDVKANNKVMSFNDVSKGAIKKTNSMSTFNQVLSNKLPNKMNSATNNPVVSVKKLNLLGEKKGFASEKKNLLQVNIDYGRMTATTNNQSPGSSRSVRSMSSSAKSSRSTSLTNLNSNVEKKITYSKHLLSKSPKAVFAPLPLTAKQVPKKAIIDDVIKNELKYKSQSGGEVKETKETNEEQIDTKQSNRNIANDANTFTIQVNNPSVFDDLIAMYNKVGLIMELLRVNTVFRKATESIWESNTKDLVFIARVQDASVIKESEYLRQIFYILLLELSKESFLSNKPVLNNLKNIAFHIHQNLLICFDYVVNNLDVIKMEDPNKNTINLQKLLLKDLSLRMKKGEHVNYLKHNNDAIVTTIKSLTRNVPKNEILEISANYAKQVSKLSFNLLNNFSSVKLGRTLKLEAIKASNSSSSSSKKVPEVNSQAGSTVSSVSANTSASTANISQESTDLILVLDLDETLIHFKYESGTDKGNLSLRPGLFTFLDEMKQIYKLIIFTASTQDYADPIIDVLEKSKKYFEKRLYRESALNSNSVYIKDLTKIEPNLNRILILDNIADNYRLHKENGILITNFEGDAEDTALVDLIPILKKISKEFSSDLRKGLVKYKDEIFVKVSTHISQSKKHLK